MERAIQRIIAASAGFQQAVARLRAAQQSLQSAQNGLQARAREAATVRPAPPRAANDDNAARGG